MSVLIQNPVRRNQRAFTLFELAIVLAIGGILAAIAVPSFQAAQANQRVKSFTQQLLLSISQARAESIKFNGACRVSVEPVDVNDWTRGWSVVADNFPAVATAGTGTCIVDPDQTTLFDPTAPDPAEANIVTTFPANDTGLSITGAPTAAIRYNRNGRVSAPTSALSFTVCDTQGRALQRVLQISPGGMPETSVENICP